MNKNLLLVIAMFALAISLQANEVTVERSNTGNEVQLEEELLLSLEIETSDVQISLEDGGDTLVMDVEEASTLITASEQVVSTEDNNS